MPRMPKQKPGKSRQDYQTQPDFLQATKLHLGIHDFLIDLAADDSNHVTELYYTEAENALVSEWADYCRFPGWGWLNPPFANIAPWVEKAYHEAQRGANVAMLVPAAVGSNWWRDWVHEKTPVLFINGRLQFVGTTEVYPKDCALILYQPTLLIPIRPHYSVWNWRETLKKAAA